MKIDVDRVVAIIDKKMSHTAGMNTLFAEGYQMALRHVKEELAVEVALEEMMTKAEGNNENDKA